MKHCFELIILFETPKEMLTAGTKAEGVDAFASCFIVRKIGDHFSLSVIF